MKTKTVHTPTPWKVSAGPRGKTLIMSTVGGVAIIRRCAVDVDEADRDTYGHLRIRRHSKETVASNAAFIVRAANNFKGMLAALKDVRDNAQDDKPEMWARIDAAIAGAEEKS